VCLVTGAGTGIGRGIAVELARRGGRVVVNYPSETTGPEETIAEIAGFGGRALPVRADIAETEEREAMFETVLGEFGRLDVLVNNAAFDPGEMDVFEVSEELFDRVLAVNLKGPFFCALTAARAMIRQGGGGRIINIAPACPLFALQGRPGHHDAATGH